MNTILLILMWAGDFQAFPAKDIADLCFVQRGMQKPSKAYFLLPDGSKKPLTCEEVPEKKVTTTIPAYWTAY